MPVYRRGKGTPKPFDRHSALKRASEKKRAEVVNIKKRGERQKEAEKRREVLNEVYQMTRINFQTEQMKDIYPKLTSKWKKIRNDIENERYSPAVLTEVHEVLNLQLLFLNEIQKQNKKILGKFDQISKEKIFAPASNERNPSTDPVQKIREFQRKKFNEQHGIAIIRLRWLPTVTRYITELREGVKFHFRVYSKKPDKGQMKPYMDGLLQQMKAVMLFHKPLL